MCLHKWADDAYQGKHFVLIEASTQKYIIENGGALGFSYVLSDLIGTLLISLRHYNYNLLSSMFIIHLITHQMLEDLQ